MLMICFCGKGSGLHSGGKGGTLPKGVPKAYSHKLKSPHLAPTHMALINGYVVKYQS